ASVRILGLEPVLNAFGEPDFQLSEIPAYAELQDSARFSPSDRLYFEIDWDSGIPGNRNYLLWLTFGGSFPDPALRRDTPREKSLAQQPLSFQPFRPELLNTRERGVNCIFIHPSEFLGQTQQLAQFHEYFYGSASLLADQQEIFETYSNGNASPVAIKNFLQDYWQSSEGDSLEYVILVGSGTGSWDLSTEKNRIIAYGSSDDNFVSFTGNYPELIISRLPAQNLNSLSMLIDRIRSYSEDPTPGWWHNMLMIMADDENKNGALEGITGDGLNHTLLAQQTENLLNKGVFIEKILGIEYDFDEFNTKPEARDAMISAINEGRLIWYYIGHGNPDVLGDEDYFRGSQHLNYLNNSDHLPLFIAASCSVGEFDSPSFDCLAERLLFLDNGGSIASLAASRACSGQTNTDIMKIFLIQLINERESLGHALYTAKLFYSSYLATAKLYNLLGDPLLWIVPPERIGTVSGLPDSLLIRQTVSITGSLPDNMTAPGEIRVYDSAYEVNYTNTLNTQTYSVDYMKNGSTLFRGDIEVNLGIYNSSFIVPDDIRSGPAGRIISFIRNEYTGTEYTNFQYPVHYSSSYENAVNEDVPQVQLWLDSRKFQTGDYVSTNPRLLAEIEDDNGINILGSAGHRILALLDDDLEPTDVTSGFIYYSGSHTKGELQWQFQGLEEGIHSLMLIVFDNFNTPAIASTEFRCKSAGKVAIEQMLPYPNPMSGDGYFTFVLTEDADITIDIFTMTGRKIRTIHQDACEAGYNQIYWNGRDGDGDRLANNTYFYKIRAKQASDHRSVEKTGKVIIFK
ncbi:MAG: hypothetical protein JW784_01035, partial [Candidatus Cloacimonetes bacterium]|nr:hypothetical protein [Candidatus Cloacimonadota bacterium]